MNDPWDDAYRGQTSVVVTASGLRVPVAEPVWPAGSVGAARTSGAAAGRARRAAGARAAKTFKGVGPKGYQRTDARIYEQVCDRMLLDPWLDASGVTVSVSNGRVSLSGAVPTERMQEAAIAAAEMVAPGVVHTALKVTGETVGKTQKSQGRRGGRSRRVGPK
jgi:osmotically-inducible protein OsmY